MNVVIVDMHALFNTTLTKTTRWPEKAPVTAGPIIEDESCFVSPDTAAAAADKALRSSVCEPTVVSG